ncbi:MAG TPA: transketolase C-terminal domain-containing protein [Streptosporangiaceae bacterium]|nr:transketolase C-terminal domain-containing protein [Streptosporangiaceae bacterium]
MSGTPGGPASRATAARHVYRDRLVTLMAADPRVVCVDTDTGLFTGTDFGPAAGRYLDLGIAEHTAMAAAAAMARAGWVPFVNTMSTFASTRALESVKINIAYNELPVRIFATHGGVAAGHLGFTHFALEDLAVMRALPGMAVVVPADASATASVVEQSAAIGGPLYVRLGRKATAPLPEGTEPAVIGQVQRLREGEDTVIVCCGPHPVLAGLEAADLLASWGVGATVLNAHTLCPFDQATLLDCAATAALVVTVEEHRTTGGLGGLVAEVLAEFAPRRVLRIGLPDVLAPGVGPQEEILKRHGLHAEGIAARVRAALESQPLAWSAS